MDRRCIDVYMNASLNRSERKRYTNCTVHALRVMQDATSKCKPTLSKFRIVQMAGCLQQVLVYTLQKWNWILHIHLNICTAHTGTLPRRQHLYNIPSLFNNAESVSRCTLSCAKKVLNKRDRDHCRFEDGCIHLFVHRSTNLGIFASG
mmetsp:Transcript_16917/g.25452  ORF Transcript_16917/g.25452 Transcript_16917/m.25452 type:complete len:148 (-) Transcript_16917:452-895(-)